MRAVKKFVRLIERYLIDLRAVKLFSWIIVMFLIELIAIKELFQELQGV